jgi:hypothetical protein
MEIGLRLIGTTAVVQSRLRVRILPRSSQLFDGVVWQSVEGKTVVSAVEHHASPQFRMPELDGSIPVDAAFVGDQIVLLTTREGRYDQWTVTLDGVSYRAVCRPDVHLGEIAWATPDGADVVWSTPAYVCGAPPPPSDVTVAVGASGAANPRPVRVSAGIGWVLGPILSAPPSSRADRSDPRVDSGRGANGRKPPSNPATCAHVHLRTRRRAR